MRILYISLISILLFACKNDLREIDALYSEQHTESEIVRDVEITYSDSGEVRSIIRAPKIVRINKEKGLVEQFPKGVDAVFYDEEGNKSSWLSAKNGIRIADENEIIVRDSVLLYNVEQDTLRTSELIWDEKSNEIYTDHFVKITNPREVIYSYGFKADQHFSRYELNQVKGRMSVEDFEY